MNNPSSERSKQAIARMNHLHSRYVKAGQISNDDILYTLSLFALEPVRWIKKYEWRALSDFELCASGIFWKAIGNSMAIDFSALPSHETGWRDGLHWLDETRDWSERYEGVNMRPARTNHELALAHLDVVFLNVPRRFHYLMHWLGATLVGERVRQAIMLPQPPRSLVHAIGCIFTARKLVLRHLMLARPKFARRKYIAAVSEKNGRYSSCVYLAHPWYVKPTLMSRWVLQLGSRAWSVVSCLAMMATSTDLRAIQLRRSALRECPGLAREICRRTPRLEMAEV